MRHKWTEVSGPLPQVNLAETELPPLVAEEEQQEGLSWVGKLRVSLTSWLGFGRTDESAPSAPEERDSRQSLWLLSKPQLKKSKRNSPSRVVARKRRLWKKTLRCKWRKRLRY